MILKKLSIATLMLATLSSSVSFAQSTPAHDSSVEDFDVEAGDPAGEAEIDNFVAVLESMPEHLQELSIDHPDVVQYLTQNLPGYSPIQTRISLSCTLALAEFVITTGFPVAKIWKTLKAAKAIAGSWRAVATMVKTHRWGSLGAEGIKILSKLTGIDSIISKCT